MINIYLESKSNKTPEYVFVRTLLSHIGVSPELFSIIPINGKDSLHKAKNQFIQNTLEGGLNLIIFDADTPDNNGGHALRRLEIENTLARLGIESDIFLFPNNQDDGDFESLLEELALKDRHQAFFGCFNDYEMCLGNDYVHPNRKGKLHAYITSMKMSGMKRRNIGSGEWLFDNPDYWNLDAEYLLPLKQFLLSRF